MIGGAVAAGSPYTVEAGLFALARGGNAVDAAVAAQLAACVAEPLLTGLGGGGLAIVRTPQAEVEVCDFFSDAPGRDGRVGGERVEVVIDFGPTTQAFAAGAASVAVPGLPAGIWALHQRHGRLPMTTLVEPAVRMAHEGVAVLKGFERVAALLWPILTLSAEAAALMGVDGRPLREGDTFRCPTLGDTLARFAVEGPALFRTGDAAAAMLRALGAERWLSEPDLTEYAPAFRRPLGVEQGGVKLWVPGAPSQGGALTARAVLALWSKGPLPPPLTAAHVVRIAAAMDAAERGRPPDWPARLFEQGFVPRWLGAGYTTHVSAVDGEGRAVAITSSLGETCGLLVPETGVLLNNFMGETDVNPPDFPRAAGSRLMTMCCPTLLELPDGRVFAMGSGGSSRIRSAVLHGLVYLSENGLTPAQTVQAPRAHYEEGLLRVETMEREPAEVARLRAQFPDLVAFDQPGMYFGGLHIAGVGREGFEGAGDPRRSGSFGCFA
ncbi:MAG: gamma-glutamyltransferase [Alphaproteobacteria bacterium]|nr:gamma-glutamyltransferase [Alphaproteobacteria bacterium]